MYIAKYGSPFQIIFSSLRDNAQIVVQSNDGYTFQVPPKPLYTELKDFVLA